MEDNEINDESKQQFKLNSCMEVLEYEDELVIRACNDQGFSIRRSDGFIHPLQGNTASRQPSKVSKIYGVAGTIRLLAGTYILVITSCDQVGNYLGFPVFAVTSMKFLSCSENLSLSDCQEKKDEVYLKTLLRTLESTPGLYYSYETDITLNFQRRFKLAEGWMNKPIWKQADPRFVWNRNIMEELIENKLDGFIISLMQGSFEAGKFELKNAPATVALISRRCTRRLGTRMWRRGANLEGDVANFIETEQLLEYDGFKSSLLQIRGSIPLLWEQIADLSYKPRLHVIDHDQKSLVVERHFRDISQRYGEIVVIDLTDKSGNEGELSAAYAAEMEKRTHVRYISFDFHHHCSNANLDDIQVLYDQVSNDFEKQGCADTSSWTRKVMSYSSRKELLDQIALTVLIERMLHRVT